MEGLGLALPPLAVRSPCRPQNANAPVARSWPWGSTRSHVAPARSSAGGGGNGPGGPRGGGRGGGGGGGGDDHRRPPLLAAAAALGAAAYLARRSLRVPAKADPAATSPVSVIVPTYNEAARIEGTLRYLTTALDPPAAEVIVVDGGSADGTATAARRVRGVAVRRARKGRAAQMNAGAAAAAPASGILVFVHADSRPPKQLVAHARRALADHDVVLGGFATLIRSGGRTLLWTTFHNFVSSYYGPLLHPRAGPAAAARGAKCLFGDQTLFCRAGDFRAVGGFDASLPIMEDADLCLRLHLAGRAPAAAGPGAAPQKARRGRLVQVLAWPPNVTSGRRIGAWGNARATAVHVRVAAAWARGATGDELRRLYDAIYTDDDAYR